MTIDLERAYKIAAALKLETVEEVKKNPKRRGILFYNNGIAFVDYLNFPKWASETGNCEVWEDDLFLPLESLRVLLPEGRE